MGQDESLSTHSSSKIKRILFINNNNNKMIFSVNKNYFEFQYVIGKGTFGKVWKIIFKKTKKAYALKEMSKLKIIDLKCINAVHAERDFLSILHHP